MVISYLAPRTHSMAGINKLIAVAIAVRYYCGESAGYQCAKSSKPSSVDSQDGPYNNLAG